MIFTFKKAIKSGKYGSFNPDYTDIKFLKKVCGSIVEDRNSGKYYIIMMVEKTDKITDDNSNCSWKNIRFKVRFESEKEAREWLNENIKLIFDSYTLHFNQN